MRWLLVLVTGCSFGMTTVPNGYTPQRGGPPPKCSSDGPTGVDLLGAITFAALAGLSYKLSGLCFAHETDCDKKPAYLILFGVPSALYVSGIVYGSVAENHCRATKRSHAQLQAAPP